MATQLFLASLPTVLSGDDRLNYTTPHPSGPIFPDNTSSPAVATTPAGAESPSLYCAVCKKRFNNQATLTQHLQSAKHIKAAQKQRNVASPSLNGPATPQPHTPGGGAAANAARALVEQSEVAPPGARETLLIQAGRAHAALGHVQEAYRCVHGALGGAHDYEVLVLLGRLALRHAPEAALDHYRAAHSAFPLQASQVGDRRGAIEAALHLAQQVAAGASLPDSLGVSHGGVWCEYAQAICAARGGVDEAIAAYLVAASLATGQGGDLLQAECWAHIQIVARRMGDLGWVLTAALERVRTLASGQHAQAFESAVGEVCQQVLELRDPVWCRRLANAAGGAKGGLSSKTLNLLRAVELAGSGEVRQAQEWCVTMQLQHPHDDQIQVASRVLGELILEYDLDQERCWGGVADPAGT